MGKPSDLVQGTLDLLILKTLSIEARHGWAIAKRIQQISGEVLQVQQGSLYPALHRLEQQGWIKAKWAESETGRQAKFYSLTAAGRKAARVGDCQLGPSLRSHQPRRAGDIVHALATTNFSCNAKCCFTAIAPGSNCKMNCSSTSISRSPRTSPPG